MNDVLMKKIRNVVVIVLLVLLYLRQRYEWLEGILLIISIASVIGFGYYGFRKNKK